MRVENEFIAHWLGDRMVEDGILPSKSTVPHLWVDARAEWKVSFEMNVKRPRDRVVNDAQYNFLYR